MVNQPPVVNPLHTSSSTKEDVHPCVRTIYMYMYIKVTERNGRVYVLHTFTVLCNTSSPYLLEICGGSVDAAPLYAGGYG